MSRELAGLLQARARLDVLRGPWAVALSAAIHLGAGAALFVGTHLRKPAPEPERKVTWITLPGRAGVSGGAGAQERGDSGERVRRVEEVAPMRPTPAKGLPTPEGLSATGKRAPVKGTNPDPQSLGQAREASKGREVVPNPAKGAAGSGGGGGIGQGSGVPGLQRSGGVSGGVGTIDGLESDFPYVWYLQQVQNKITTNWYRPPDAQDRVLLYFRIRPDGTLDNIRRETPSPNPAFNDSAEQAVRRANPMPPLPPDFKGRFLGVWFWFKSN